MDTVYLYKITQKKIEIFCRTCKNINRESNRETYKTEWKSHILQGVVIQIFSVDTPFIDLELFAFPFLYVQYSPPLSTYLLYGQTCPYINTAVLWNDFSFSLPTTFCDILVITIHIKWPITITVNTISGIFNFKDMDMAIQVPTQLDGLFLPVRIADKRTIKIIFIKKN